MRRSKVRRTPVAVSECRRHNSSKIATARMPGATIASARSRSPTRREWVTAEPLATGVMGPTTTTTRHVTIPMKVGPSIPFAGFASAIEGLGEKSPCEGTGPMSINKRACRLWLRRHGCTTIYLSEKAICPDFSRAPLAISVSYSFSTEARLRIHIVSTRDGKPGFFARARHGAGT